MQLKALRVLCDNQSSVSRHHEAPSGWWHGRYWQPRGNARQHLTIGKQCTWLEESTSIAMAASFTTRGKNRRSARLLRRRLRQWLRSVLWLSITSSLSKEISPQQMVSLLGTMTTRTRLESILQVPKRRGQSLSFKKLFGLRWNLGTFVFRQRP